MPQVTYRLPAQLAGYKRIASGDRLPKGSAGARQGGFALLATLWLTTLLALIGAGFTTTARTEIQLGHNVVEKAKAEALADAGVHLAVLALLQPDPTERWRTDGTVYTLAFGTGEVRVAIQDEAGKLDLNTASNELLRGLFVSTGLDEKQATVLVNAVADFRDPNDLRRLHGAAAPDYRAAGLARGPKDAPFEAVEELQQVLGMTPALYRRLAPLVTVHSGQAGIDPLVAPPGVLVTLPGADAGWVEALLTARHDLVEGLDPDAVTEATAVTAQDGPGRNAGAGPGSPPVREGPPDQRRRSPEAAGDRRDGGVALAPLLAGFGGFLTPSPGLCYTVRAEGRSVGGGRFVRSAVVAVGLPEQPDQPYRFRTWDRAEAAELD